MGGPRKLKSFEAYLRERARTPTRLTIKHLAQEVGIAYPTAIHYIDRLQSEGKLKVRRQGRRRVFHYTGPDVTPVAAESRDTARESGSQTPALRRAENAEAVVHLLQEALVQAGFLLQKLEAEQAHLKRENQQLRNLVDTLQHLLRRDHEAAAAGGA